MKGVFRPVSGRCAHRGAAALRPASQWSNLPARARSPPPFSRRSRAGGRRHHHPRVLHPCGFAPPFMMGDPPAGGPGGHRCVRRVRATGTVPDALQEMFDADALLILQAAEVGTQVPAKLYEYLRVGKPILALYESIRRNGRRCAGRSKRASRPSTRPERIQDGLKELLARWRDGVSASVEPGFIASCSRQARTAELAALLDGGSQHDDCGVAIGDRCLRFDVESGWPDLHSVPPILAAWPAAG